MDKIPSARQALKMEKTQYLVIGSGIAGLRAALELAGRGKKVMLVTKSRLEDANTYYAQGGVAAVDPKRVAAGKDSYESLTKDTLEAGKGLCDPKVVQRFARESFQVIEYLIDKGVKFTKVRGDYPYVLHQEGGHEHERIYCVGDITGKAIEDALASAVRKSRNIRILENHIAIDLITLKGIHRRKRAKDVCLGAYILDKDTGNVRTVAAGKTFLATGGAGRVFQHTSNPENATGDGIAMAYRAGARLANMEFFQFHPTVLYEPDTGESGKRRFLLTEALRGAAFGGILTIERDSKQDFILQYNPDGSHSTRDIVARAIDTEMKKRGIGHVWLNVTTEVTGKTPELIKKSFPQIYEKCLERGIDITKDPIPVIPAAHYTCGGVLVDENGLTDIDNLYAIGEAACTGLMGANRLASNSLPEGALYAKRAVRHALIHVNRKDWARRGRIEIPQWKHGEAMHEPDKATMRQIGDMTRQIMTNLCGIERNEERLRLACRLLQVLSEQAAELERECWPTHEMIELNNITCNAMLIARAALIRKESRGGHYRTDFQETDGSYAEPIILLKGLSMEI